MYQTIDGTLIGFYRERGGEVLAVYYRDVYEYRDVIKTREENVWIESTFVSKSVYIPGFYDMRPFERPGRWEDRAVRIPAHEEEQLVEIPGYYERRNVQEPGRWEIKRILVPEYSVTRYREVPGHYVTETEYVQGHYEIQNIWVPEYYVTRYYWREAHPARGLEAAWIPYEHLIPAGYKEQRVWVEGDYQDEDVWIKTYTEEYQELIPEGYKDQRVWVEGEWRTKVFWVDATWEHQMVMVPEEWGTETIWIEPISRVDKVWVPDRYVDVSEGEPGHWEMQTVEYTVVEKVWVGYEPVYGYVDESQVRLFEVVELLPNVVDVPDYTDVIVIRNCLNGDELKTTAKYVGMATRIADNEFVVPEEKNL